MFKIKNNAEYERISKTYSKFKEYIEQRKIIKYEWLEKQLKLYHSKFDLQCTDKEYYIVYDGSWVVRNRKLIDLAHEFRIYIKKTLDTFKKENEEEKLIKLTKEDIILINDSLMLYHENTIQMDMKLKIRNLIVKLNRR